MEVTKELTYEDQQFIIKRLERQIKMLDQKIKQIKKPRIVTIKKTVRSSSPSQKRRHRVSRHFFIRPKSHRNTLPFVPFFPMAVHSKVIEEIGNVFVEKNIEPVYP